jgi:hypothetical protein
MMFTMPKDPAEQIKIHEAMVARCGQAKRQIDEAKSTVLQDIKRIVPGSEDYRKLMQAGKNLRMQELCVIDQEKRLKERIDCLRIGSSMAELKRAV